jgi:hypothetical protein
VQTTANSAASPPLFTITPTEPSSAQTAELAASDARSALAEPPPVDAPAAAGLFGEAPYRLRFGT